ncbi:MAG: cytochrome c [Myxococcales bacterium]|nr:cytochrome c [Myxococcales bacterium]MBK7198742.1 cytochrome c [Myxococcales bacterium]MBP6846737.1 cytochrome c [Kofleriaceae bacterium]
MRYAWIAIALATACGRTEPAKPAACPPATPCPPVATPAPIVPPAPTPPAAADCAAPTGANPVQTEMRRLECALQQAVAAIGRDELPAIAHQLHVVHAAKEATAQAIAAGTWAPATGDVKAFVALDQAFHRELEALVEASMARDHAAAAAALGRTLGGCQGCHAAFRPAAPAPTAPAPAAAPHDHAH